MAKNDLEIPVHLKVKVEPDHTFGFWTGFAACAFLTAFLQDLLGKEKWLAAASASWTNTPVWIWPIAMIAVAFLDWFSTRITTDLVRRKLGRG